MRTQFKKVEAAPAREPEALREEMAGLVFELLLGISQLMEMVHRPGQVRRLTDGPRKRQPAVPAVTRRRGI